MSLFARGLASQGVAQPSPLTLLAKEGRRVIPGLVLPVGLTHTGLPVAIEFDAPAGADRALLALGLDAERALGTLPAPRL